MIKKLIPNINKKNREYQLIREFSINLNKYNEMLKEQNYNCKICNYPHHLDRNLCVDHCHITGKIRGLLCRNCNLALGNFKDNVNNLLKAIEYLETNTEKKEGS